MDKHAVIKIAKDARQHIEGIWYRHDLRGACGLASWHLMSLLRAHRHPAVYRGLPGHYWVELHNNVIDITATQFNIHLGFEGISKKRFRKVTFVTKQTYYNYDNPWCLEDIGTDEHEVHITDVTEAYESMREWTSICASEINILKKYQRTYV